MIDYKQSIFLFLFCFFNSHVAQVTYINCTLRYAGKCETISSVSKIDTLSSMDESFVSRVSLYTDTVIFLFLCFIFFFCFGLREYVAGTKGNTFNRLDYLPRGHVDFFQLNVFNLWPSFSNYVDTYRQLQRQFCLIGRLAKWKWHMHPDLPPSLLPPHPEYEYKCMVVSTDYL